MQQQRIIQLQKNKLNNLYRLKTAKQPFEHSSYRWNAPKYKMRSYAENQQLKKAGFVCVICTQRSNQQLIVYQRNDSFNTLQNQMAQLQSLSNYLPLGCTQQMLNQPGVDHEKQNSLNGKFTVFVSAMLQTNLIASSKNQIQTSVLARQWNQVQETERELSEGVSVYAKIQKQKDERSNSREDKDKDIQTKQQYDSRSKAQLVREIQLQIQLLESKSKQPGIKSNDLQPLGHEIYEKIDQYYIRHGVYKNTNKQLQITSKSFLNKITNSNQQKLSDKVKKSTQRSHSPLSDASTVKNKVRFSRLAATHEEELQSRKIFKTCQNMDFSVSSISQKSKLVEEMPFFETKMSESDLAALDKPFEEQSQAEFEGQYENYLQLKESIRVMQERIVFLIHRLEQTKTELSEIKQENMELRGKLKKQSSSNKQLKNQHQLLCLLHENNVKQIDNLQYNIEQVRRKVKELQQLLVLQQKQNDQLKRETEYLHVQIGQNQKKISKLQSALRAKIQECNQLTTSYRQCQEEEKQYKKELLEKIEEREIQNSRLQKTIRDYRSRVQVQGLSFKFEEAHKLKQLIQDSSALHAKQLRKIDEQYSKIIESLKVEMEKHVLSKRQLQSALVQYLGLRNKSKIQKQNFLFEKTQDILTVLQDVEGKEPANQFIALLNRCKEMEREVQLQKELVGKYHDRVEILKQDSQEKFAANKQLNAALDKKKMQVEELRIENEELKKYLRQNVSNMKKRQKGQEEKNVQSCLRKSKIQSRIIEISVAKPTVADQSQLTLQSFMKKKALDTPNAIVKFVIKLISFSEELQETHRRKLPSLAPHSVLLSIKKLKDLDIAFSAISKKEEEEGLMYQAPQILLGFSESAQSHCWTIGVIFDQMLHGRKFFKSFGDILSHNDNYLVEDDKFKSIEVLTEMVRKNHKQRKSLVQVKCQLQHLVSVLQQKYRQ